VFKKAVKPSLQKLGAVTRISLRSWEPLT